jgi:DNA-directed RNA polymerase subunit alpha
MLIDADFSPVKRVNVHVERFAMPSASPERLILEVWTNGSVTPETAVADASRILDDHFALLIHFAATPPVEGGEVAEPAVRSELNEDLFRSAAELFCGTLQLPEGRQHPHHRGPGAEDGVRAA